MNKQAERLMERFDLAGEVEQFVRERVAAIAQDKQQFGFVGSCRSCGNHEPHVPHSTGSYGTVRYGELADYCPGVSGDGLEVVVTRRVKGCPDYPSELSGYWLAVEPVAV